MVEHDGHVGELLKLLDELGVADNTIVVYTTDNGAEVLTWPDGGTTPFRGEKATNWEGGFRVPCVIRWPGVIKPGTVVNDICAHEDFLPTFAAAAGEPDLVEQAAERAQARRQDLQGAPRRPQPDALLQGRGRRSRRAKDFLYWSDDGDLMAIRVQPLEGHRSWSRIAPGPRACGRASSRACAPPTSTTCARIPFERGDGEHRYGQLDRRPHVPDRAGAGHRRASGSRELQGSPRQKPASFNLDAVMEQMSKATPQAA